MSSTQRRVTAVLERLATMVEDDEDFADALSDDLEELLNNIQAMDGFGTEGQCDPRGDYRDGDWAMDFVEGVDDE